MENIYRKLHAQTPFYLLMQIYQNYDCIILFVFPCREGVQFMFDCVSGLSSTDGISGCILADDMG